MDYKELLDSVMTSNEAAEEFSISTAAVRLAIRRGTIPARKAGGARDAPWLIPRAAAEAKWGYRKRSISHAAAEDTKQSGG